MSRPHTLPPRRLVVGISGASGAILGIRALEMLRETNTMGSKANDARIAQLVVEIKGHIDRIKEQTLNIV